MQQQHRRVDGERGPIDQINCERCTSHYRSARSGSLNIAMTLVHAQYWRQRRRWARGKWYMGGWSWFVLIDGCNVNVWVWISRQGSIIEMIWCGFFSFNWSLQQLHWDVVNVASWAHVNFDLLLFTWLCFRWLWRIQERRITPLDCMSW